jgi:hypothetical protein
MAWFITSIYAGSDKQKPPLMVQTTRCFGFYMNYWTARKAIEENRGSMCECLYDYLVMECIHAVDVHEEWWKWDGALNKWVELEEKPEDFRGIVNFAIG